MIKDLNSAADSRPVFTGLIGVIMGWGTAFVSYLEFASKIFAFLGTLFGAVAACYTCLIVMRRYARDVRQHPNKKD